MEYKLQRKYLAILRLFERRAKRDQKYIVHSRRIIIITSISILLHFVFQVLFYHSSLLLLLLEACLFFN